MAGFNKRVKTQADLDATRAAVRGLPSVAPESHQTGAATVTPDTRTTTALAIVQGATQVLGARQESAGVAYIIGQVYDIPVGQLHSNPVGPRSIYPPADVDDMAAKLKQDGQRQSATAFVNKAGLLIMIDGETRLRGARQLGSPTLRIEIKAEPENERALYEEARSANSDRREQSPLDDALRWRDMLDRKVYVNQGDLAKSLGLGEDVVSRTLSLTEFPMRIVHIISDNHELLTLRMLTALREYFNVRGEDDTVELIYKAARDGMGYRDVQALRKTAEKPAAKRPRSDKEPFMYGGVRGELRVFTEEGRVELAITGLGGEDVAALHERLKTALASAPTLPRPNSASVGSSVPQTTT